MQPTHSIIHRYFSDLANGGSPAAAEEILAHDFVFHEQGRHDDLAAFAAMMQGVRAAFPDIHFEVHDSFGDEQKQAVRFTIRGTHQGNFMGLPPTGKHIAIGGIDVFRLSGGRIAEVWACIDLAGALSQLGVLPPA